jgi:hypothetical protein
MYFTATKKERKISCRLLAGPERLYQDDGGVPLLHQHRNVLRSSGVLTVISSLPPPPPPSPLQHNVAPLLLISTQCSLSTSALNTIQSLPLLASTQRSPFPPWPQRNAVRPPPGLNTVQPLPLLASTQCNPSPS